MVRLACVELPAFLLQILLRRFPDWVTQPVAVIADDRPQGQILWVNTSARRQGLQPGMRYATAVTLAPALRAAVVAPPDVTHSIEQVALALQQFSPKVEPAWETPGVFWLDVAGLLGLYPSLFSWGQTLVSTLRQDNWRTRVVVGFSRVGTAAVVRTIRVPVRVFSRREEEEAAIRCVPLSRSPLSFAIARQLAQLGIQTLGDLVRLPLAGVRERFGKEILRFLDAAHNSDWPPLQPWRPEEPLAAQLDLDTPESDRTRLVFLFRRLLLPVLHVVQDRHHAVTAVQWTLILKNRSRLSGTLRPAAPTLKAGQLIDLIRLRLDTLQVVAGVTHLALVVHASPAYAEQRQLLLDGPVRDLAAANRALARVRATFGEMTVVRACLRAGHLPEAQFTWEPLAEMAYPRPRQRVAPAPVVRRILQQPLLLASPPRHERHDGWLIAGAAPGPVMQMAGPFLITGGWWQGEVEHEYAFVETQRGDLLWVFYDRRRRRWMLQGRVE
ncbi:MAG: DNA polymerase Y family protein [Candidatus Binatia bacterium]